MSDSRSEIKELARKGALLLQTAGDCLVISGVAVNLYILIAPADIQQFRTCENGWKQLHEPDIAGIAWAVFIQDLGLYVFNTTLGITGIAIPAASKAFSLVKECVRGKKTIDEESSEKLNALKETVLNSLNLGVMAEQLPAPDFIRHLGLAAGGAAPLVRHGLRSTFFSRYPQQPSLPALKEAFPDQSKLAKGAAFVEAVLQSLNVAGAMNAVSGMILNYGVNASREVVQLH
jgi:hypothetical protein